MFDLILGVIGNFGGGARKIIGCLFVGVIVRCSIVEFWWRCSIVSSHSETPFCCVV